MKIPPREGPATAWEPSQQNNAFAPSSDPGCAWLLLRHARTLGRQDCFVGRSDRSVGDVEPALLADLAARIGHVDTVVVTPLQRTRQTLDLLLMQGLPQPRTILVEPDLVEQDFGAWEERSYDELAAQHPDYWAFWDDPAANVPPDGESFGQVCRRVRAACRLLSPKLRGRVLHIGHAGPIRALLGIAIAEPADAALTREVTTLSLHRMQTA